MASLKRRGTFFLAWYYVGGRQKPIALGTDSHQIARGMHIIAVRHI